MILAISPRSVVRILSAVILSLGVLNVTGEWVRYATRSWSHRAPAELADKFVLNSELSFPAWYSSVTILGCAVLLAVIAVAQYRRRSEFARHWAGLAVIFLLMSIDEMSSVHEMFIVPLQRHLGLRGVLLYAWVVPGSIFVAAVALAYRRFLFVHLERATRWRFIAAGSIFVSGALGLEFAEGYIHENYGTMSLAWFVAVTIEELLEMVGILVFLHGLMCFVARHVGPVRIVITPTAADTPWPIGSVRSARAAIRSNSD